MMVGFFNVLSAAALLTSILALFFSVRSAARVRELQQAKPDWRASRLQSIETSIEDLAETVSALANKIKMMRVRTVVAHPGQSEKLPDPYKDPDGWRKAMNSRLASDRLGLSQK